MISKVFSIWDQATLCYSPPFTVKTVQEAQRMFRDLVNDPNSRIAAHPADYTLFELGTWDDETAFFTQDKTLTSHGLALEYLALADEPPVEPPVEAGQPN